MQNSDNTLNLKQALLELLKVVKKNHYTKDENDSKLSLKVDDIIYQVDKNNLESEIKNLELSDEQIIGIINNEIKTLIPNQATNENQLADKDFVNSSISTATATFRGTYTNKDSFPNNVDANDYVFYDTTDELGNRKFDKYKYSNGEWVYEYTLNNSSFTEEQWKSINSGATIELINKISINEENINNLNNNKLEKETFNSFKLENNEALNTKVDKIEGKGLSTNDFTNELKEKLNGIEANAQVNTITGVKGDNEVDYRVGNVSISKENIGLGNVDNTSDKDKPISTATQQALDLKADKKDVSEVDIDVEGTGSIVSIPENATGYGTIEKLGGKSYKSANLLVLEDKGETTTNGITYSIKDGVITLNGTASSNFTIYLNLQKEVYLNGSYTIGSFNLTSNRIDLYFNLKSGGYTAIYQLNVKTSQTITYTDILNRISLFLVSGSTYNLTIKLMLVSGSIAPTEFSQGFEGIKIEYPTNVKVVGRNLCNGSLFVDNKGFNSNGVIVSASGYKATEEYISIKPNTTYTITNATAYGYKSDKTFDNFIYNKTFTTKSTMSYIRIESKIGNNVMLVEGSTALPYQPYTEQNLPQTNIINYVSTQLQTNHSWTQENASKWLGLGVGNDSNIINYANNKKGDVKYSIINLGDLDFVYDNNLSRWYIWFGNYNAKLVYNDLIANIMSDNYTSVSANAIVNANINTIALASSGNLICKNGSATEKPTGKLIYELETPIEIDLSSLETEEHFECESNGSIIHDNIANYKYSFPVSLKGQVELNFEHDKEQQRDIDSLKKEIDLKANDSELDKSLYNLGAFDTISGNVITRQTGYVDLGSLSWSEVVTNCWKSVVSNFPNIYTSGKVIVGEKYKSASITDYAGFIALGVGYIGVLSTYQYIICMSNGKPTGFAQYKLTTSYPEEIIEGQPLITLDSQGSQWLRTEWEKGLNLCRKFSTTAFRFIMTAYLKPNKQYYFTTNDTSNAQTPIVVITDVGGKSFTLRDNIYGSYLTEDTFVTPVDLTEGVATITIHINVDTIQVTQTMLNEGDHPYPYQPYNSKAHITNYEADFLKEESLKSANILKLKDVASTTSSGITYSVANNIITLNGTSSDFYVILPLEKAIPANTTISGNIFRNNTNISVYLWKGAWVSALNISTFNTVTTESEYSNIILQVTNEASLSSEIIKPMVWKGTEPLPYQEYNGSIVREKQIEELKNEINSLKERIALLESKQ